MPRRTIAGLVLALTLTAEAVALERVGHRGARGRAPENTLPAFQQAVAAGATTIEADVAVTRDGIPVVAHDHRVRRLLCRGPGVGRLIRRLGHRTIRELDCGTRRPRDPGRDPFAATQRPVPGASMPRLGQVLRLARAERVRVLLELKLDPTRPRRTKRPGAFVRAVLREVRRERSMRRVTFQSFDWGTLRLLGRRAPQARLVGLIRPSTHRPGSPWLGGVTLQPGPFPSGTAAAARHAGFDGLAPPAASVSRGVVDSAHARGLAVLPWTVNDPGSMRALADLGVDAIITDFPGRLSEAMASR